MNISTVDVGNVKRIEVPEGFLQRLITSHRRIIEVYNATGSDGNLRGSDGVRRSFGYSLEEAEKAVRRVRMRLDELKQMEPIDDPEQKLVRGRVVFELVRPAEPKKTEKRPRKISIVDVVAFASGLSGVEADSILAFKFGIEETKTIAKVAMYCAVVDLNISKAKISNYLWCQPEDVTIAINDISSRLRKSDTYVLNLIANLRSSFRATLQK